MANDKAIKADASQPPAGPDVFSKAAEIGNARRRGETDGPESGALSQSGPVVPPPQFNRLRPDPNIPLPNPPAPPPQERPRTPEEQDQLEKAYATIRRLSTIHPFGPGGQPAERVLKKFRVRLSGVTSGRTSNGPAGIDLEEYQLKHFPEKIDFYAYSESEAWDMFLKSWGIVKTDHSPSITEVRDLVETPAGEQLAAVG